jgi:hypothetical protein
MAVWGCREIAVAMRIEGLRLVETGLAVHSSSAIRWRI